MGCSSGKVLSFWPPVGKSVLHCDLLCVHSPGFAKKTFISYSKSFKDSFRQGRVVEIDLKNQTVLLEDGEVSKGPGAAAGRTWAGLRGGERPLAPEPCLALIAASS